MDYKLSIILVVIGVQLIITQAHPQPLFGLGTLYERFLGPTRPVSSLPAPIPPLVAAQQGIAPRPLGIQPAVGGFPGKFTPAVARPGPVLPAHPLGGPGLARPAIGLGVPARPLGAPGLARPIGAPGLARPVGPGGIVPAVGRPGPGLSPIG